MFHVVSLLPAWDYWLPPKGNLSATPFPSSSNSETPRLGKSPFKIAVINDEISQDFGHACEVASQKFGMEWMELRSMWNKNVANLDANEIAEAQRILKKNNLRVTDIASPLFKVDFAGAPKSKFSPEHDQFNANFTYDQQGEVLDRAIELAKKFSTDRIRCFDFWRLDDQGPYRKAMNDQLQQAAEKLRKIGLILILENEFACNTATGAESAKVLERRAIPGFHAQLGPRQRRHVRRDAISRRLQSAAQKPHRSLPLQRRDQNGQGRGMGRHRQRHDRLGGSIQSSQARRLSPRGEPGNSLARRRHSRSFNHRELGRNERCAGESRGALMGRAARFTERE